MHNYSRGYTRRVPFSVTTLLLHRKSENVHVFFLHPRCCCCLLFGADPRHSLIFLRPPCLYSRHAPSLSTNPVHIPTLSPSPSYLLIHPPSFHCIISILYPPYCPFSSKGLNATVLIRRNSTCRSNYLSSHGAQYRWVSRGGTGRDGAGWDEVKQPEIIPLTPAY